MEENSLSIIFSALADPTRRSIIERLSIGESTVNELAEPFNMSLPAISKHLKVLEKAGLITRGKDAQWRPCKIQGEALKEASDWISKYKKYWEDSFDRLEDYLKNIQTMEKKNDGYK